MLLLRFLFERLIMALITVFVIIFITFFLMNTVPGGPFLSEKSPSPQVLAAMEAKYGLDRPLHVQFQTYFTDILKGDFGVSFKMQKNRPVLTIIMEMLPVSIKIGVIALVWASIAGIILGCVAAFNRGTWIDDAIRVINTFGYALPSFVTATCLLVVFAGGVWRILPSMGLSGWKNYLMPCFTLGLSPMCHITRHTRASMLDVLEQDYVRTARAKGLPTGKVIFKHALRNALITAITYIGYIAAFILTGSLVVETVFNIPGLGRYFVQSIGNRDYPLIMGTTIILSIFVCAINFVVDVLYRIIDPRIQLTKEAN
jgi:oligopeptide transport system permease protein